MRKAAPCTVGWVGWAGERDGRGLHLLVSHRSWPLNAALKRYVRPLLASERVCASPHWHWGRCHFSVDATCGDLAILLAIVQYCQPHTRPCRRCSLHIQHTHGLAQRLRRSTIRRDKRNLARIACVRGCLVSRLSLSVRLFIQVFNLLMLCHRTCQTVLRRLLAPDAGALSLVAGGGGDPQRAASRESSLQKKCAQRGSERVRALVKPESSERARIG